MISIENELNKIDAAKFFSAMGENNLFADDILAIENVKKVFVEPSYDEFEGVYDEVEWLPSSPTQVDPFYGKISNTEEVVKFRKEINKAVLHATRGIEKDLFLCSPHDFSGVARNAICFAFRQLITEKYFSLGNKWSRICEIYYSGHWPVGFAKKNYIVI